MSAWQPIETAPRDGSIIIAFHAAWTRPSAVWWETTQGGGGQWMFDSDDSERAKPEPTHWQSLPAPPEDGA